MNELKSLPAFLGKALLGDPALRLATLTAWLDPAHFYPEEYVEDYPYYADRFHDEDGQAALMYALGIARRCFPEVYAVTVQRIRRGDTRRQVTQFYCAALNTRYPHVELWDIEDMLYGVPCQWAGLEPLSPEFVTDHPELVALLADFGIAPQEHTSSLSQEAIYTCVDDTDFEMAACCASPLIHSMVALDGQPWADIAFLLMWLFSASGNSLVDHSPDSYWDAGFEPLEWEPDTLQLVDEAHRQAAIVLGAARRGLDILQKDVTMRNALRRNVKRVKGALEREDHDVKPIRLNWPPWNGAERAEECRPGDAESDAALLLLRRSYAQDD